MRGENKIKGFLFIAALMALGFFADAINAEVISPLWGLLLVVPAIRGMYKLIMEAIE